MSRPRLLVLASTFPSSPDDGTPAFVRDLAIREAEDFDVLVLVPQVPGAPRQEASDGIVVERFRYFPSRWEDLADGAIIENLRARKSRWFQVLPFLVAEAVAVRRAVRRFSPDVAHVHWIVPQGVVVSTVTPTLPYLLTTLGGDLYALNAGPIKKLKERVVRRARRVTVMNNEMKQKVEELGALPDHVTVMPMGADLSTIRAVPRGPAVDGRLRLLFVGRLVEKKGLTVLLAAIRQLNDPSVTLTVVGDGPLRTELVAEAEGLPVTFVGQVGRSALAEQYASHDVVVAPSLVAVSGDKDGLPVALIEAMGAGCAIIASDLPGINEAVTDGLTGCLVKSGSVEDLERALRRLVDRPSLVSALGEAAFRRADQLSADSVGARYRSLLGGLIGRPGNDRPGDDPSGHCHGLTADEGV